MINWVPTPKLEERIVLSFKVPEIRSDFVENLNNEIQRRERSIKKKSLYEIVHQNLALSISLAVTMVAILVFFVIGPQKVYAEFEKLLGFIPGIGIVDQNSQIRQLAAPVSITKGGVTVSVTSAILTSEKTYIAFGASGVSSSAYPEKENGKGGCTEAPYMILPNGEKMIAANEMGPIPQNINQVTFVLPCIFNTLPGTVPTDWELPLQFVPATSGLAITPVLDIPTPTIPEQATNQPTLVVGNPLHLLNILDIGKVFVLQGEFRYGDLGIVNHDNQMKDGSIWVITNIEISDAGGHKLENLPAEDIPVPTATEPNAETWNLQIDKGFVSPLTITYEVEHIQPIGAPQQSHFTFNVGQNPQDGESWTINQTFSLGDHIFRLTSVSYSTNSGYVFQFSSDPGAEDGWVNVGIDGYVENCGGGGGGSIASEIFTRTFCIIQQGNTPFPVGDLSGTVTFQPVVNEDKSFIITLSPDAK